MPIYQLRCLNCKQEGEFILPLNAPTPLCGKCQSKQEKLMSAPAMVKIDNIPLKYKSLGVKGFHSWEPGPNEA